MAPDLSSKKFRLGKVRVQPSRLMLEFGGGEHRVEPRVMEILVLLAKNAGQTVSREQLRDTLWDAYVSDDAIHRAIWKLRRSLGDHAELIETVSKRGYRLTVEPQIESRAPAGGTPVNSTGGRYAGIAVTAVLLAGVMWIVTRDVPTPAAPPAPPDAEFAPFSSMSGYETQPDIDSSGATVVFANYPKEGNGALQWDLWSRPFGGGAARRLTSTPEHETSPAISPEGSRVAFLRMTDSACGFFVLDLADGQEAPTGLDCGVSRGPTDCCRMIGWRDDETLLMTRREDRAGPVRIYELDLASGDVRTLTDPPAQSDGDVAFAVSHDHQRVAIGRRRTPEIEDLFLLHLATGELRQLTSVGYPISGLAWGASDRTVIFGWNRTGTSALWQIDADGGMPVALRTVGMNASGPAVRGADLIYEEWKSEINLWELDTASAAASRLVGSTRWDWRGVRSPDGGHLAFISNRGGDPEIWLAAAGGSDPTQLTQLGRQIASTPVWSPDGRWLAVSIVGASGLDIARINSANGAVEWVVTDASDEREPSFSADGARIYFSSNRTGGWEVWAADLGSSRIERWTRNGGGTARAANDGGIWFARHDAAGLWHQRSADSEAELIDPVFAPSALADWTVVRTDEGDHVYYVRWDETPTGWLSRLDPLTGTTTDLIRLESDDGVKELFGGGGLWVSPDGSRTIVSSVDLSHSDLWLRRSRR